MHLWTAAVLSLSHVRPLAHLAESTRLRFSYACILARGSRTARNAFAHMLRRNLGRSLSDDLWLAYTAWCFGELRLSSLLFRAIQRRAPQAAEAQVAEREASFAEAILNGTLRETLAQAVDRLDLQPEAAAPLVIVPVSSRYLDLFQLWKRQLDRHTAGTLIVLAMDDAANQLLTEARILHLNLAPWFGFDAAQRIEDYSKRHLWVLRVFILRELLARGHIVLSLDLDAVLVGDLAPLLTSLPAADIVAQKDYSIPIDAARQLGFTVCCGFLLLRPGSAMNSFLEHYARATAFELDDQTAINHLLARGGIADRIEISSALSFTAHGMRWVLPDPAFISRDISSGSVIRHFQQNIPLAIDDLTRRLELD